MQDQLRRGVHLLPERPIWQEVAIKEPDWTVLMEIKDNLNEKELSHEVQVRSKEPLSNMQKGGCGKWTERPVSKA